MTDELEEILDLFTEESTEGLDSMEAGLLALGDGLADGDTLNAIFRAAHTMKGGASMLGFEAMASFTHAVETVLDAMRNDLLPASQDIIDLLLDCVDCARGMLAAAGAEQNPDHPKRESLTQRLETLLVVDKVAGSVTDEPDEPAAAAAPEDISQTASADWRIRLQPGAAAFRDGSDPGRLLLELAGLGDLTVDVDLSGLPQLTELDPDACYLNWDMELRGEVSEAQIREVFEWLDQASTIAITPADGPAGGEVPPDLPASVPPAPDEGAAVSDAAATASAMPPAMSAQAAPQSQAAKSAAEGQGSIRVATDKVDSLVNLVGELVITQSMLARFADNFDGSQVEALREGLNQLLRNTRELQEGVLSIRMLPIQNAFARLPRLVRDLSRKLGKQVELTLKGESTEVDKTVLEKIGDPLIHLVRNALDHGLEDPETRIAVGKTAAGQLTVSAFHESGNIVIEITDDGAGLHRDKILARARERGLVPPDEELSDERIDNLIFQPGFSTAVEVSDVSGRGVGMDVVRRNIKDLGGNVDVRSVSGEGSTVTIRLPLTLAILDGQLIRVGDQVYVLPLLAIVESQKVQVDNLKSVVGRSEVYALRDHYIPVVRIENLFGLPPSQTPVEQRLLVVVEVDDTQAGLLVDDLQAQQQVVIKSLEANFRKVDGLAGATILGDGSVAMIIDPSELLRRHLRKMPSVPLPDAA